MPGRNGSDGSITIDTGLDTKGFDRGSKELLDAIHSLTQEINRLGQTLQTTFSGYGRAAEGSNAEVQQLEATVQTLEAQVQGLNATIAELAAKLAAVGGQQVIDPASLTEAGTAAGSAVQQIAALQARIEELEGVAADLRAQLGQIDGQSVSPTFSTVQPKQAVTGLEKDIDKLGASMKALDGLAEAAISGDMKAIGKFDTQARKAQDTLDGLRQRLDAFGNTRFETNDYKWIQAEIEKADNALQKLLDRQARMRATGVRENSRAYRSLQYDIEQAEARLQDLLATQQIYENSGNAIVLGADTAQFEQYRAAIEEIEAQLAELQADVDAALQPPHMEQWNSMITLSGMIRGAFTSAFETIRNGALMTGQAATHPIQAFDRFLGTCTQIRGAAKKAVVHLARLAGRGIVNGVKQLASAALRAAGSILTLGKNAKKSKSGLKSGLMSILKYGLGIRSVYALVNKLRAAIVSGFENLAQYSNETNQAISSMKSALSQFKNSIAAAFAPIVNVVAPIITRLIGLLTAAIDKIGQFFAALSGQKTYIRAKAVQEDYAASLQKTTKKSKEAREEAKEAARQLAGFDELEILRDNSSKNSDKDDDAESGTSPKDMFETIPVGDGVSDFVEQVKAAWAAADFTGIGRIIGDKLKSALDSIPWGPIQNTAGKVGKSIATLLNGVLETPGLFTGLGRTLAEAVNTALTFLDSFSWNFHWDALGEAIADVIIGLFSGIDWDLPISILQTGIGAVRLAFVGFLSELGEGLEIRGITDPLIEIVNTVTGTLQKLIEGTKTWFGQLDFTPLVTAFENLLAAISPFVSVVSDGLLWAYENVLLPLGTWTIEEALPVAVNLLAAGFEFLTTVFEKLGPVAQFLWESILQPLFSVAWDVLSTAVTGVASAFQKLSDVLSGNTSFSEFLDSLAPGEAIILGMAAALGVLGTAFAVGSAISAAGTLISGAITAIGAALTFLTSPIGIVIGVITALVAGLTLLYQNFEPFREFIDGIVEGAKELVPGIIAGIQEGWSNFKEWLGNKWQSIVDGFRSFFGINSPSTVMAEQGGYIIDGLLDGILKPLKSIGTWIKDHIFTPFINGFKKAFGLNSSSPVMEEQGGNIIDGLLDGIVNGVKGIGTWIKDHTFGPFIDGFQKAFKINSPSKVMEDQGGYIIDGLKNGIKDAWKNVKKLVKDCAEEICTAFKNKVRDMLNAGKELITNLKNGITSVWSSVKSKVTEYAKEIWQGFKNKANDLKSAGSELMTKLKEGLGSRWTEVKTKVSGYAADIAKGFESKKESLKTAGSNLMGKLHEGLNSRWGSVKTNLSNYANSIKTTFSSIGGSLKTIGGNLMVGLYNGLVEKWNSLVGNIRNIANSITNTMRSAFDEHSPSKIWAQIGRYLMEGLAIGLTGEEKNVLSTVSDIAAAVSEEMANGDYAIPKIEANTASAMDGFSNAITDSFSDMLDRLQAIADGVTFTVPAVASGAIPYQLMAESTDGGNAGIKGAIEASNEELASVVIQSVTNATVAIVRAIEDNSGTTVNLDKNSIAQAVIDEINRKTRMMNANPLLV